MERKVILNNDKFLDTFEKNLSLFTGAKYVVLTDRCTNAIFLSLWYYMKYRDVQIKEISIPARTYQSIPMTLKNLLGLDIVFTDEKWVGEYKVFKNIYDCAVNFSRAMYKPGTVQCISFQQKKALPIGKGGAILLDDKNMYETLKRLSYDGRGRYLSDREEIQNDPERVLCGFHMNMSPDEAAKGILLLNQFQPKLPGTWEDYEDLRQLKCF